MNGQQPTGPEHRPDHPALRLDAACDRFEAAWKKGQRPRIEDFLGEATVSERPEWLQALLDVELDCRRAAGEAPTPDEYRRRFPEHPQLIADAFAESQPRPGPEPTVLKRSVADSNLLFGILALQNNFISREALVNAFNAWIADKSRSLGQILRDRGDLDTAHGALLEALAREHLKLHGGDPQESLGALSSLGSAHYVLQEIADPDVQDSLRYTAVGRPQEPGAAAPAYGVSRFRILRPHAKGGLGEVFVAEDKELHREVALKEIQLGRADDRASRTRFVLEAEITGNLEHPGVVPVYGLGHYGNGRPFYAMRFVQGDSLKAAIARFHAADIPGRDPGERALALRGLLGRFIDVCDAIAYAHSREVLHRDLKPGNIMLGKYGETLVVDWGLAKVAGQAKGGEGSAPGGPVRPHSASGSAPTVPGVAMGTRGYMSPEQAAGDIDRLGTWSDVYSLGATLYCLLTGRAPLEAGDSDIEAVLRRVRAGDIAPPRRVKRDVPPALEAVCLKAMALRPEDRYASARALAEDIEHWLADEPVSAWHEPWPVRGRRWAKRHRTTVAAALVALLAGVVGLGAVAGVQARANVLLKDAYVATNQALAETRTAQAETKAALTQSEDSRKESEESRKQAEAVSTFLVEAFRSPDPELDGRQVKVADLLDRANERLDEEFAGSQATKGALLHALGATYRGLGLNDRAMSLYTRARAVREAALGPGHSDTLASANGLANTYLSAGRLPEAIALYEATLKLREAAQGPDDLDTLKCRINLALAYQTAGRLPEAIALHNATLGLIEAKLGPDHPHTLQSRINLAFAYQEAGRTSEAIALYKATLGLIEAKLSPDHPQALVTRNNLASTYAEAGRLAEAIPLFEETLRLWESKMGADHINTLQVRNNLARAYAEVGRWAEAEHLERDVLDRRRKTDKPDSPLLAGDLAELGHHLLEQSRWSEAEPLLRECLAIREKSTPDDWRRYDAKSLLGGALLGQGRYDEAEPLIVSGYEQMTAREARILVPERSRLREAAERIVRLYEAWNKPDQATEWKARLGMRDLPADVFAPP
jgi:eukaryotic-like serine/threonine-protein kinase